MAERFSNSRMMNKNQRCSEEIACATAYRGPFYSTLPSLSVIVPTYNRSQSLRNLLRELSQQTYPSDRFEVILVDDGSTDGTESIIQERFPFNLRYYRQSNKGDAAARNLGARHSIAELLVFIDDDMVLDPDYLTGLVHTHEGRRHRIVSGLWDPWLPELNPLVEALSASEMTGTAAATAELSFTQVHSNNMALNRDAFFEIGMMQSLEFSGSSIWCDLEFNYRAYQKGFEFRRSHQAICWHQDHHTRTLHSYSQRWKTAAYRSVVLFQKYPGLIAHTPMFHDKTPISWGKDKPRLILRKMFRSLGSTRAALWCMEQVVRALENRRPDSGTLRALYRYVIGGYIFRGYREGLGDFGPVKTNVNAAARASDPS